jgi:hypothetical protein
LESKQHSHRDVAVICEPQVRKVMTKVGYVIFDGNCARQSGRYLCNYMGDTWPPIVLVWIIPCRPILNDPKKKST